MIMATAYLLQEAVKGIIYSVALFRSRGSGGGKGTAAASDTGAPNTGGGGGNSGVAAWKEKRKRRGSLAKFKTLAVKIGRTGGG